MHFPNTTPKNPVMRGIQGHETGSGYRPMWIYTTVQSQKVASAYFRRTQILPFSFAEQHTRSLVRSKWSLHFMYKVSLGPLNMVRFCTWVILQHDFQETWRQLGVETLYLPPHKVTDTTLRYQDDDVTSKLIPEATICSTTLTFLPVAVVCGYTRWSGEGWATLSSLTGIIILETTTWA